jgi:hypothetical protein
MFSRVTSLNYIIIIKPVVFARGRVGALTSNPGLLAPGRINNGLDMSRENITFLDAGFGWLDLGSLLLPVIGDLLAFPTGL